jgi:hypothetical protein
MRALSCAVLLTLLLTGCGGQPDASEAVPTLTAAPTEEAATETATTEPTPEPTAEAAACGDVQTVPVQGGEHLIGDQEPPVPYTTTPPTSGWHTSGAFQIEVFEEPISEPQQVSVLEAGAVVVSHHELDDADRQSIEDLVRDDFDGRAAVTPYDALEPGQVALTAWATLQLCEGVDLDAIAAFIDEHADEQPDEPGHGH